MKDYNKMYTDLFNELVLEDNDENEKMLEDLKEKLKRVFEVKSQICKNININFMFRNIFNEELFIPYINIKEGKKEIIIFLQKLDEDIILELSYLIKNIKKEHKNNILDLGFIFLYFYNILKNTKNVKSFSFY